MTTMQQNGDTRKIERLRELMKLRTETEKEHANAVAAERKAEADYKYAEGNLREALAQINPREDVIFLSSHVYSLYSLAQDFDHKKQALNSASETVDLYTSTLELYELDIKYELKNL